jgi:hypothetical protein
MRAIGIFTLSGGCRDIEKLGALQNILRTVAMASLKEGNSTLRKNRYIFASAGAVLGVAAAGMGSLAAALVGAVLGGVLGYHLLTRIGGGTESD